MGSIYYADSDGGHYASPQTEPESGVDYRYVIEPLEYVVEHRLMDRGQIMEEGDPDYG
jgi:hypothetical protein